MQHSRRTTDRAVPSRDSAFKRFFWWIAPIALVAIGAIGLYIGQQTKTTVVYVGPTIPKPSGSVSLPATTVPTTSASSGALSAPVGSATIAPSEVPAPPVSRSTPIRLTIPAIGVSTPLTTLGLNPNGTVQVPTNFAEAGWYRLGVSPGQRGSAVILGHVDNYHGPAVFYRISELRVGERMTVTLASGKVVIFQVIGMRMYPKTNFPDQLVYGPRSYSALQLVTCGGIFDRTTGHYLSNIVVFTKMVKV